MKRLVVAVVGLFIYLLSGMSVSASTIPVDLRCEYLRDPLGLDVERPRLSWRIKADGEAHDVRQTAYRIIVASSRECLDSGTGDLWDSGKVRSDCTLQIPYSGLRPQSGRPCWWKVCVWDGDETVSEWSEPAFWTVGPECWAGQWIGDVPDMRLREYQRYVAGHNGDADFDISYWESPPVSPSPLLRKTFRLEKPVKHAFLYASAIGYYEMWVNGVPVSDRLQAPEYTDYDITVQYQTYDMTDRLCRGENVLSATLADGWALGRNAGVKWMRCFPHRGFYACDRRLLAQLEIEYDDGSREVIASDGSWKINTDGYVRAADNFGGEDIDARKMASGWNDRGFDDDAWGHVYVDGSMPPRVLTAQKNEPIKVHHRLRPVRIWPRDGRYMVDFGQNIAGHCRLTIKGDAGQVVTLRHGEWLNEDGSLYTQSLGYAKAIDRFVLSGGDDCFEPTFTYHGFQYVEVDGLTSPLTPDMITAEAVSSDCEVTGHFECSNPDLNQLYRNVVWTQRNNMFSVLHDNPSRDERTGAAGDVQIFAQSAIFNMDMAAFFSKYMTDFRHIAHNGQFFSMIPSLSREGLWNGWIGAPGWCEAGFIVPWRLYENYADTTVIRSLLPYMKRHIDATLSENPDLIWRIRHNHNGDWLNANTISSPPDETYDTSHGATPDDLFATAFFGHAARLLSRMAATVGENADAARYAALADKIRTRFIAKFVGDDGSVEGGTQGAYSIALYFDMIPDGLRNEAFEKLVECIEAYDYRLSTGFISTPMMMQLLSDFNRMDIAYRLLESTRFPSWLYIVKNGATTVWERWDAWIPGRGFQNAGMNSLDHVAFGAVSEWMFRNILGINPDVNYPGYARFILHPRPGGGLTWASGSYNSIRGEIKSSWRKTVDGTVFCVTVPENTSALLVLPAVSPDCVSCVKGRKPEFAVYSDREVSAVIGSGCYEFVVSC